MIRITVINNKGKWKSSNFKVIALITKKLNFLLSLN